METETPSNNKQVEMSNNSKKESKTISFLQLFSYATSCEYFLLFLGIVCTLFKALTLPGIVIIYGEFAAMLVDRALPELTTSKTIFLPLFGGGKILTNVTEEESNAELYNDSIAYGILMTLNAIVMLVAGILSIDIFNFVALRQVTRIRTLLFESVMRQDISWHDLATKHNFVQTMADDIEKIRNGIAENVSQFVFLVSGFFITVAISFAYGWKLTLAVSAYIPFIVILNYVATKYQSQLTTREQESYSSAGNLVEEVIGSIRTVISFNGESKESERFDNFLIPARKASQRRGIFSGISDAVMKSMLFISSAGAFWYGINLIIEDRYDVDKEYTPAILMIVFFGIFVGADNLARATPFLESFSMARSCATNIFNVIETESKIDPFSRDGKILTNGLNGDIEFRDVFFSYPMRQDVIVHRGMNFTVRAGETVALVGSSGCGKSTCIQLLQRFYDPMFGAVMIDDLDIRKYNLNWLRSNIAVVGQEPVLFLGTIGENIRHGKPDAAQQEVEAAAKSSGVHDFIVGLPNSYDTLIGERGSQLSGGQKQRIAIARALIQNPKILLLDEATSALDYQSEKLVQQALDVASKGRTTIVVSHRLSAIRGADRIVFMRDGKVIEEGSHDKLIRSGGLYCNMVQAGEIKLPDQGQEYVEKLKDEKVSNYEKTFETNPLNLEKQVNNAQQLDEVMLQVKTLEDTVPTAENKPNFYATFKRILRLARPEWCFLFLGGICAMGFGFTYPLFSVIFGELYSALADPDDQNALDRTAILSMYCLALGIFTAIVCFTQTYFFNYAGVWLTTRMRSTVFKNMMQQEVGWFDEEQNSVGALSARISGDTANVQGAIGYPLSGIIQALSNFILGLTLSFIYSWELALLCLTCFPFIIASVIFEAHFMTSSLQEEKKVVEESCRIAAEAITNVRTVAGLRREQPVIEQYSLEVDKIKRLIRKKLKYRGFVNSFGMAFLWFGYGYALCFGGVLVSWGYLPFEDVIKVSEILLYGSLILAQSLAFVPTFTTALFAAHRIFQIIDRKPKIVSTADYNGKNTYAKDQLNLFDGVRYRDIQFSYPTRRDVKILQGLNLDVFHGKTVALVGHSGCGKSTCIQLLQRYYDPDFGSIHIDYDDIQTDLTLKELRSKLGLVSQEPSLFARSIAENIMYGCNDRKVETNEIIDAAKAANAHNFIMALPNGYDTLISSRGSSLSGGQKQRIAIARALIRNPRVLLLDEATSALDLQSEQIVQQALDEACSGRTCIVIAHRLSTVQNADLICVMDHGQIIEQGTHFELLGKDGVYAKLHKTQINH